MSTNYLHILWEKTKQSSKLGSIVLPAKHLILDQNWLSVLSRKNTTKSEKKGCMVKTHQAVLSLSLSHTHTHSHKHTYKTTWTGLYLVRGKNPSHTHSDCCTSSSVSNFNIKVIINKFNKTERELISTWTTSHEHSINTWFEDVILMEFTSLLLTCMPGKLLQFGSSLFSYAAFQAQVNSLHVLILRKSSRTCSVSDHTGGENKQTPELKST